jgi:hypothetical protein
MGLRFGLPTPPTEIADEVELYAREWGRHATLHFVPTLFQGDRIVRGSWIVRFTLRSNDPRMRAYQEGRAPEPATEDVWLQEPNPRAGQPIPGTGGLKEQPYLPLNLTELGAGGVRRLGQPGHERADPRVPERREPQRADG